MFKLSNETQGLFHKLTYFCGGFFPEGTNIDLPNEKKKKRKKYNNLQTALFFSAWRTSDESMQTVFVNYYLINDR